jgi:Protein of unknown function (DUF1376)
MAAALTGDVTSDVTSDVSEDLPEPLVGIEVDVHDFESMPLDVERLRDSDLAVLASAEEFRAAVLLWCAAWHQIPAGSLPNDERILAKFAGFGRDLEAWRAVASGAMRGFVLCSDQRLYHPVVVEKALDAFEKRKTQSKRTAAATRARLIKQRNVQRDGRRNVQRDEKRNVADLSNVTFTKGIEGKGSTLEDKSSKAAGAAPTLEKQVFDLGKPMLGSGGQVKKLILHHGGDLAATKATLELAATKTDPREYVGAILRGDRQPEIDWDAEYRRMGVSL